MLATRTAQAVMPINTVLFVLQSLLLLLASACQRIPVRFLCYSLAQLSSASVAFALHVYNSQNLCVSAHIEMHTLRELPLREQAALNTLDPSQKTASALLYQLVI